MFASLVDFLTAETNVETTDLSGFWGAPDDGFESIVEYLVAAELDGANSDG